MGCGQFFISYPFAVAAACFFRGLTLGEAGIIKMVGIETSIRLQLNHHLRIRPADILESGFDEVFAVIAVGFDGNPGIVLGEDDRMDGADDRPHRINAAAAADRIIIGAWQGQPAGERELGLVFEGMRHYLAAGSSRPHIIESQAKMI